MDEKHHHRRIELWLHFMNESWKLTIDMIINENKCNNKDININIDQYKNKYFFLILINDNKRHTNDYVNNNYYYYYIIRPSNHPHFASLR